MMMIMILRMAMLTIMMVMTCIAHVENNANTDTPTRSVFHINMGFHRFAENSIYIITYLRGSVYLLRSKQEGLADSRVGLYICNCKNEWKQNLHLLILCFWEYALQRHTTNLVRLEFYYAKPFIFSLRVWSAANQSKANPM